MAFSTYLWRNAVSSWAVCVWIYFIPLGTYRKLRTHTVHTTGKTHTSVQSNIILFVSHQISTIFFICVYLFWLNFCWTYTQQICKYLEMIEETTFFLLFKKKNWECNLIRIVRKYRMVHGNRIIHLKLLRGTKVRSRDSSRSGEIFLLSLLINILSMILQLGETIRPWNSKKK